MIEIIKLIIEEVIINLETLLYMLVGLGFLVFSSCGSILFGEHLNDKAVKSNGGLMPVYRPIRKDMTKGHMAFYDKKKVKNFKLCDIYYDENKVQYYSIGDVFMRIGNKVNKWSLLVFLFSSLVIITKGVIV